MHWPAVPNFVPVSSHSEYLRPDPIVLEKATQQLNDTNLVVHVRFAG